MDFLLVAGTVQRGELNLQPFYITFKIKNRLKAGLYPLVAGAGLEPTTFGL